MPAAPLVPPVSPAVVLGPFAILVAALVVMLRLRAAALRGGQTDPAAWFAFCHRVQWLTLGAWLGWFAAVYALGAQRVVAAWVGPIHPLARYAIAIALGLLPPAGLSIAFAALSHAVSSRMRGIEWTLGQTLSQVALRLAGSLVPISCAALAGLSITSEPRIGILIALAGIVSFFVFNQLHQRALDFAPHAVTTGPLRDRVFALAAAAKVTIRQIYVLPMAKSRVANAFAVHGQTVMLTDYLLAHLGRREVDAILAHEVTHLRYRHPLLLALTFLACTALTTTVLTTLGRPVTLLAVPFALAIGVLGVVMVSRRLERTADAGMVDLTGDAEAAISALVRLNRLNHMPLEWGKVSGQLMTHPSTARRARAIGARGGLPPERIAALLEGGGIDDGHYEAPPMRESAKVFSTRFKTATTARISWLLLAVLVLTPLLTVLLSGLWGPSPIVGLGFALAGFAGTVAFAAAATNLLSVAPYRPVAERLRERFLRGGLDPDREGGVFVGFAPGAEPRIYEQFYDWDVGFLFPRGERLVYVGEETRFALHRDQVRRIERIPGPPSWIRSERLRIDWADPVGAGSGHFLIRPAEVGSLRESCLAARALEARLAAWRLGGAEAQPFAPGEGLVAPALGEVTSASPRTQVSAPRIIATVVWIGIASLLACVLAGMIGGWRALISVPYVFAVALGTQLLMTLPVWRWRDAPAPPARAAAPPAESRDAA